MEEQAEIKVNSVVYYTDSSLRHTTHAVRDIRPGEELTISYVDSFRVRAVRRERALRSWGFSCACAHCSLPAPLANASDNRLYRMYELERHLSHPTSPVAEDAVDLLLSLYSQERMADSHAADAYTLAALYYSSMGWENLAVKYALLSLEQGLLETGPEGLDVRAMVSFLEDPTRHSSWRRRVGL